MITKNEIAKEFGKMGGKAVLEEYGRAHFSKLGKKSAKKRRQRSGLLTKKQKKQFNQPL